MFVRAYLRASTTDQDASRARDALHAFAEGQGRPVAAWYGENASGTSSEREELARLLADARPGDILLVEAIDRLTRLDALGWDSLRRKIEDSRLRVVSLDLPTSHAAMIESHGDDFTDRMLDSLNRMLIDVLAAVARKDWEDRRRRTQEGIARASAQGKYKGRPKDHAKRAKIENLLNAKKEDGSDFSIREVARLLECSPTTVKVVKRDMFNRHADDAS